MIMETPVPNESLTYRLMLEEVEKILGKISAEDIDLDNLVAEVEKGYALIKTLRLRLNETRNKIEKLRLDYEQTGEPHPAP